MRTKTRTSMKDDTIPNLGAHNIWTPWQLSVAGEG